MVTGLSPSQTNAIVDDHFVQRRGNQPGKAYQIRIHLFGGSENFLRRHHHAKIDDFVVVTLQDHANDIFADIVGSVIGTYIRTSIWITALCAERQNLAITAKVVQELWIV